jgi:hypothetical protein
MVSNIYDKFDIELLESLMNNQYKIKKHLSQYKKEGMMLDKFLVQDGEQESIIVINFDGEMVEKNGQLISRFD